MFRGSLGASGEEAKKSTFGKVLQCSRQIRLEAFRRTVSKIQTTPTILRTLLQQLPLLSFTAARVQCQVVVLCKHRQKSYIPLPWRPCHMIFEML